MTSWEEHKFFCFAGELHLKDICGDTLKGALGKRCPHNLIDLGNFSKLQQENTFKIRDQ